MAGPGGGAARGFPRARTLLLATALLAAAAGLSAQAAGSAAEAFAAGQPAGRAVLLRGPEQRRGLPFFSPNALPALVGEYAAAGDRVRVWSTRAPIAFSAAWQVRRLALPAGLEARLLERGEGPVLAFRAKGYTLFFEFGAQGAALERFALAFERRFSVFFERSATDAELSFPASVDFTP
ncbi:MAG: hypothetical protein JNG85_06860 [Spirochaetaceae bacterium]|nr:hypothetical protein [Spirochaetaceae bacterium]